MYLGLTTRAMKGKDWHSQTMAETLGGLGNTPHVKRKSCRTSRCGIQITCFQNAHTPRHSDNCLKGLKLSQTETISLVILSWWGIVGEAKEHWRGKDVRKTNTAMECG